MYRNLAPGAIGISADLRRGLELAKEGGFEGLDVPMGEVARIAQEQGLERVKQMYAEAGLRLGGWGLPVRWAGPEEEYRQGLDLLRRYAALAGQLGATRCYTWVPPASDERPFAANFRFHVERFKPIAEILAENGCRLGLEFIGPATLRRGRKYAFLHSLDGMLALAAAIGTGNVGLLLDCWHWYTSHGSVDDLLHLSNEDVVYVHINDAPEGVPLEEQRDNVRRLPGQTGVIDLVGFLGALQRIGYDGPVTPEPFYAPLQELPPEEAVRLVGKATQEVWRKAALA